MTVYISCTNKHGMCTERVYKQDDDDDQDNGENITNNNSSNTVLVDLYFRTVHVVIFILFKPNHALIFLNTFTFTFKTLNC
jgi:hypothetical protein